MLHGLAVFQRPLQHSLHNNLSALERKRREIEDELPDVPSLASLLPPSISSPQTSPCKEKTGQIMSLCSKPAPHFPQSKSKVKGLPMAYQAHTTASCPPPDLTSSPGHSLYCSRLASLLFVQHSKQPQAHFLLVPPCGTLSPSAAATSCRALLKCYLLGDAFLDYSSKNCRRFPHHSRALLFFSIVLTIRFSLLFLFLAPGTVPGTKLALNKYLLKEGGTCIHSDWRERREFFRYPGGWGGRGYLLASSLFR